jgi:catechol 2,3-dioxygenase-like lactoylglutathione lyase family enzyme
MNVQFVTSVAPIVRDAEASRSFYRGALGVSIEGQDGDYMFTHKLKGTKHFGLWPLSEPANAGFGTPQWPTDIPVPQASIEFEVPDVAVAAAELRAKDYRLIHDAHPEVGPDHGPAIEPRRLARRRLLLPVVPRRVGTAEPHSLSTGPRGPSRPLTVRRLDGVGR